MVQETDLSTLVINKLTRQQYEGITTPNANELYLITDEIISSSDIITGLGYTPENQANKVTSLSSNSTNTQYPSAKLVYDQLALKQPNLVSGTNIKTINGNSLLGSGDITIDSLPSQIGNDGKYLTTNGTTASWASVSIPSVDQTYDGTSTSPQSGVAIEGELTTNYQPKLVSGTDIKTINSGSLLGSGNLDLVTTDTAQSISGKKTFLGEKAILFKQSATTDKLGFTLYNLSGTELGALEWRPNTINGNALLALNCPQSGSNYVGFRYWSNINIIAPRPTTNGNYFIPVNITDGTNTVTANNNGTLNISSLLPDISDMATQTWVTNQGYTTNVGTVTSVNNTQPDASGNVTLTIPDTATWGNITGTLSDQTDLQTALDAKQNTISDLPTIRSGASLGATALQPNDNISDLTDDTATYPIDKAESVVDNNSGSLTFWSGTKAQYDAIVTKDANTLYNVEDTTSPIISILDSLYPIGSIYIGTMSACPLQTLGVGTWQLVATDRVLQGAGTRGSVGSTVNESLPNITGTMKAGLGSGSSRTWKSGNSAGAFTDNTTTANSFITGSTYTSQVALDGWSFNAHNSNATYQNNAPVQQDAYLVNIWERIS